MEVWFLNWITNTAHHLANPALAVEAILRILQFPVLAKNESAAINAALSTY